MMKNRISFTLTLTTEKPLSPKMVAAFLRVFLLGQKIWGGKTCEREGVRITKVAITGIGEK